MGSEEPGRPHATRERGRRHRRRPFPAMWSEPPRRRSAGRQTHPKAPRLVGVGTRAGAGTAAGARGVGDKPGASPRLTPCSGTGAAPVAAHAGPLQVRTLARHPRRRTDHAHLPRPRAIPVARRWPRRWGRSRGSSGAGPSGRRRTPAGAWRGWCRGPRPARAPIATARGVARCRWRGRDGLYGFLGARRRARA